MIGSALRTFRDKDYLKTKDGLIFNVIGYKHSAQHTTANLKYVQKTKWASGYWSSVTFLKQHYPHYVVDDLVSVPRSKVVQAYFPREGLSRILAETNRNDLEQAVVDLTFACSEVFGIPLHRFGITDSLLWSRGRCGSDIDLVVYGQSAALTVLNRMRSLFEHSGFERLTAANFTRQTTIESDELEDLSRRKFNKGLYRGVRFSIRAVRDDDEIEDFQPYFTFGTREFTGRIADNSQSLFFPATYEMDSGLSIVSFLMKYEAVYRPGEVVKVTGKLERGPRDRIVVGSLGGDGHGIAAVGRHIKGKT